MNIENNRPESLEKEEINMVDTTADIFKWKIVHAIDINAIHPLETEFKIQMDNTLVWQNAAKQLVAQTIKNAVLSSRPKKWPLWVLFFSWPTWVGKTELVKSVAKTLFGNASSFTKINCENYQESHSGTNLFGAPKSYLWYWDPTPLEAKKVYAHYDAAKKWNKLHPAIANIDGCNIILFDEIEKMHPQVHQSLLWLLDEGRIEFTNGEIGTYNNSIIIFTSNIGQKEIELAQNKSEIWFIHTSVSDQQNDSEKKIKESITAKFSPEFRGRIDAFVNFESLTNKDAHDIIQLELKKLNTHLKKYYTTNTIQTLFDASLYEMIIEEWFSQKKWARWLVNIFEMKVESQLNNILSSQEFDAYFYHSSPVDIFVSVNQDKKIMFQILVHEEKIFDRYEKQADILIQEPTPLTLKLLKSRNIQVREYIQYHRFHIDDSDIDFSQDIRILETSLRTSGFSQDDLKQLKNTSLLEVLSDITSLGGYDIDPSISKIFYPFSIRCILKYVDRKIDNYLSNPAEDKYLQPLILLTEISDYLSHQILQVNALTPEQSSELIFFIWKRYRQKYGIDLANIPELSE